MEIPVWLTMSGAVIGLCGGTAGLISAAVRASSFRTQKTNALRSDLSRAWTNEGDVRSKDNVFVTLDLKMQDGDVVGSVQTSTRKHLLNANLETHFRSATLTLPEGGGRIREVAVVRLHLKGNRNRVKWRVISGNSDGWLPETTLLWPTSVQIDSWRSHGIE